jgi:hypothetical protein
MIGTSTETATECGLLRLPKDLLEIIALCLPIYDFESVKSLKAAHRDLREKLNDAVFEYKWFKNTGLRDVADALKFGLSQPTAYAMIQRDCDFMKSFDGSFTAERFWYDPFRIVN